MSNKNLNLAKNLKNDEFYTPYSTVEQIIEPYKHCFKNKIIYCNCDDCWKSNFVKYFIVNFNKLKLKKLITTCFVKDGKGYGITIKTVYPLFCSKELTLPKLIEFNLNTKHNNFFQLNENGDFRTTECTELLKSCDIICTNPPFSLFKQFFKHIKHRKYLIIGNALMPFYKDIMKLLMKNKINLHKCNEEFTTPSGEIKTIKACYACNLDLQIKRKDIFKFSGTEFYPNQNKYSYSNNYKNVLNVNKLKDIPCDYNGIMAVPITYCLYHNKQMFEIITNTSSLVRNTSLNKIYDASYENKLNMKKYGIVVNEKEIFGRVFLKKIQ